MTVNPFWFGVLMTIVAEVMLFLIFGAINTARAKDDDESNDAEMKEVVSALSKAFQDGNVEVLRIKTNGDKHEDDGKTK